MKQRFGKGTLVVASWRSGKVVVAGRIRVARVGNSAEIPVYDFYKRCFLVSDIRAGGYASGWFLENESFTVKICNDVEEMKSQFLGLSL